MFHQTRTVIPNHHSTTMILLSTYQDLSLLYQWTLPSTVRVLLGLKTATHGCL